MHFFSSENISAPQWSAFQDFFDCCPSRATTVLSVNHRHKIFVTKTKRTGPKDKRPVSVFSRCRNKNFGPDGTRGGGAGGADRSRSLKTRGTNNFSALVSAALSLWQIENNWRKRMMVWQKEREKEEYG